MEARKSTHSRKTRRGTSSARRIASRGRASRFVALIAYAAPFPPPPWRRPEAQAEAEATFLKRRAELKAEAEHADMRLDLLDKRVELTSLGFREVVRKVAPNVVNVINLREPR